MAILGLLALSNCQWTRSLNQALYDQEKQFRFAQGALDCAISKARRDFDAICKNKKIVTGVLAHGDLHAELSLEPQGQIIMVACTLQSGSLPAYRLSAELIKDSQSLVRIQGFQR